MTKKSKHVHARKKAPIWVWAVLAVIALVVIGGVVYNQLKPASLPDEISVSQAETLASQGGFILDVRQPEEWNQFHIPGATLIPLGELPSRLSEVPKDKPIIVVCRTGNRSAQGRDILRKAGFANVTSMAGGVTEWQAQGLTIATGP